MIADEVRSHGIEIGLPETSDVVIVNTCTVTGEADVKVRKEIRRLLRTSPTRHVVVTGCAASLEPDSLMLLGDRVLVEADKALVAARVREALSDHVSARPGREAAPAVTCASDSRSRMMLKVQDGCDCFCAYCIVPFARGAPRSRQVDSIIREAERLVASGFREIVVAGINVGRYQHGDTDLPRLLDAITRTGVSRLRLSSIEPLHVTDSLLEVMSTHATVICQHLHIPLQSGSDEILARMGRRYRTAEFAQRVGEARNELPALTVTTDVIAGFPGESEAQARETLVFCERMHFDRLHVFRYSPRFGTRAAAFPDQVPSARISSRAAELRALDSRLRNLHANRLLGSRVEVLVEVIRGRVAIGTTREYLRVGFETDADLVPGALHQLILRPEHLLLARTR
jgi:threonylcarbamoyladenosine tRNA methylthiotransferase MtaB